MEPSILVIDDDDDSRYVIALSLQYVAGWQVFEADGRVQGIEIARRNQPDAILLDVLTPGMDGPATLHKLKAARSTRHIPVMLVAFGIIWRSVSELYGVRSLTCENWAKCLRKLGSLRCHGFG